MLLAARGYPTWLLFGLPGLEGGNLPVLQVPRVLCEAHRPSDLSNGLTGLGLLEGLDNLLRGTSAFSRELEGTSQIELATLAANQR
jgi:hypothetical protein